MSQRVHLKLNRRHYTLVLHENSSNNAYFIVTKQSCITHTHKTQNFNSSDKLIFWFFFPSLPVLCWIVALNIHIYIMIMVNKIQRVCWRRLGYDMAKIERKSFCLNETLHIACRRTHREREYGKSRQLLR